MGVGSCKAPNQLPFDLNRARLTNWQEKRLPEKKEWANGPGPNGEGWVILGALRHAVVFPLGGKLNKKRYTYSRGPMKMVSVISFGNSHWWIKLRSDTVRKSGWLTLVSRYIFGGLSIVFPGLTERGCYFLLLPLLRGESAAQRGVSFNREKWRARSCFGSQD